ncbi:uncharacterized protein K02A2.6-like, partial [Protobothrops mucrosquamatus]|uniref:uncharacterized protein K02A2.6-like n=1 Tax=Protobothrops mucrosquamatus TaxID=103944 RepID=UPI0010FB8BA3
IGLDWFEALGIQVTGLHHLQTLSLADVYKEFADVFSSELRSYKGPPIALRLDPTITPIRVKPRRVPFALKGKIDAELYKLLQQGILEPVDSSPWETPIVMPLKANGEIRICADYKCTLNKALQQHAYPVPVVSHILASLKGGRIFAKLDLAQAYQQLPVDEAAAEAQTIVTHRGAFKVKRLQFGVNVAPGIFQSVTESTLRGIPGVCPYFDDVLIAGGSSQNLAERLRAVLLCFRKAGLKLKQDKCKIGVASTEFLGFRIDAQGIRPAEDKLLAIQQAPSPKSKSELQAFLGLLNFYHAFPPHKAAVALLTSNAVLAHFNEQLPVCIACDASPYGVGAVLSHLKADGTQVPVAYYSRTLSSAERNYAQIDREALAIVAGIKKFHYFLYGRHFTVYTDHKPLLGLFTTNKQTPHIISPRMLRWSIFLSAYDYTLVHKPGKEMGHADGLRWPDTCPDATFQRFWQRRNALSTFNGCLLWGSRVVIPASLRSRILSSLHEGHPGIVRMKALARSHLWWPGLDKAIEAQVHGCQVCQQSWPDMPQAPVHRWGETHTPWSRVHLDYAGPFQGQFFLILVDSHSKWLEVVPVSSTTTARTIQVLRGIFATHGLPDVLVSDNGPQFTSCEFQAFLQANLIQHATSAPFYPSTNGQADRMAANEPVSETVFQVKELTLARSLAKGCHKLCCRFPGSLLTLLKCMAPGDY